LPLVVKRSRNRVNIGARPLVERFLRFESSLPL
jgi:hypothetical protein